MKSLEIIIVVAGMPFAADTLKHKSLGGSETAGLSLAKALKDRGHIVTVFCNLPQPGSPDFLGQNGGMGSDGVRYASINDYGRFIAQTEVDLLIAQRMPELLGVPHQARKAVLWAHDLATYNGQAKTLQGYGWNMDEIWCVSEWHADQYAKVSGYPRSHIKVLRNAITEQDIMPMLIKDERQLVYAARPERGLENLVRPGGIMSRLPDFQLKVCMYDNFPEHMREYYGMLFSWASQLPNVELLGSLTQLELRTLLDGAGGYIYPTAFEETSCILAQEAMERGCLFMTTRKGALPETLGDYGVFYEGPGEIGSDEFCQGFADMVQETVAKAAQSLTKATWVPRYWSHAAEEVEGMAEPAPVTPFSLAWSMVEESDIIPAMEYISKLPRPLSPALDRMRTSLMELYPYLFGKCTFAEYYERYFVREDSKGARQRRSMVGNPRFEAIAEQVAALPATSTIIDYGCAEGVIILDLALRFRDKTFYGIDFAATNVALCNQYAMELGLTNVWFFHGSTDAWPAIPVVADAVICSEVLEHVEKPWEVIGFLENRVRLGGRVITTVPAGPWEALGLYDKEQFQWRAHIWHITKWMLRTMFADKTGCHMASLPSQGLPDGRAVGHTVFAYNADHKPTHAIKPMEKVARHRARQTVTACIIVDRADSLQRMLKSIGRQIQVLNVLITGNFNEVLPILGRFGDSHPWVQCNYSNSLPLAPRQFGFDDARNMSMEVSPIATDWVLWIDEDEYLSGDFRKFLRVNAFDSYSIHQHHFTCDPRGAPTQLDKPARLFRTDRGFQFYGKVHEHAEKGFNGGPGFCFILPDVDIGHVGYVNESVRRDRFGRNFAFMEWDHEVNPERNIGKFLWLRDIIHRMRYFAQQGQAGAAQGLALEAVDFYKGNWKEWSQVGMGGEQAIGYYSEALTFLGRGLPVTFQMKVNDAVFQHTGVFADEDEVLAIIRSHLAGQFDQRRSGYWQ